MEALGKIVEQGFEVALLGDGFGDFEKGFHLASRVIGGRGRSARSRGGVEARASSEGYCQILHEVQNSIRFGEVTTEGRRAEKRGYFVRSGRRERCR